MVILEGLGQAVEPGLDLINARIHFDKGVETDGIFLNNLLVMDVHTELSQGVTLIVDGDVLL